MHHLALDTSLATLLTLVPVGVVVALDTPATSTAQAQPTIRLVDPGSEPRQELRYALTLGHTDRSAITTSVANRVVPPDDPMRWPEPIALRVEVEQTVLAADTGGVYELETVYTDVQVVDDRDDPMLADMDAEARESAGTSVRATVDEQGRVLSAETITGPDWAARGIHLGIMPGLIDVENLQLSRLLPDEPVGIGAIWEVTGVIPDPVEHEPVPAVITTTLERLHPDGSFELSSVGRIGPLAQELTTLDGDHVVMTFESAGKLSARWNVDPGSFTPEGRVSVMVGRTTTPMAKGVDPTAIETRMVAATERVFSEP